MKCISVCIPNTYHDAFDYLSDNERLTVGKRVIVPFRKQKKIGVVIAINPIPDEKKSTIKYKFVDSVIDENPIINSELLSFFRFTSHYYHAPLSEVLTLALPKKIRQGKALALPTESVYELSLDVSQLKKNAKKQIALFHYLKKQRQASHKNLVAQGFNSTLIKKMESADILKKKEKVLLPEVLQPLNHKKPQLNDEQSFVASEILKKKDCFNTFLIQGVTGSGKTEVYFECAEAVLKEGKQVLMLVPEIGLTPQLIARVSERLPYPLAFSHSNLNDTLRFNCFVNTTFAKVNIVVGTRSALFLPFKNLQLIIIDEEHDLSFKQQDGVRYSARDLAIFRAQQLNIPIVLGSATPTLESLYNAQKKKYQLLTLKNRAIALYPPLFKIIDLRRKKLQAGLSEALINRIKAHVDKNQQVLVFINRRGFAPVYLCNHCGEGVGCPHCSTYLTLHLQIQKLCCHHCHYQRRLIKECTQCKKNTMIALGVGTEQIANYLSDRFKNKKVLRIDSDTMSKKQAFRDTIEQVHRGDADILVGTQMLAKGHHFPNLTLVAIVDIDQGFYSVDFRAIERLGQLLVQVAGRAGRAHLSGEIAIQTHLPEEKHLLLLIQKGYMQFAQTLLKARQATKLPPFSYLALLKITNAKLDRAISLLQLLANYLKSAQMQLTILGPVPSVMEKKAGVYQAQLLLKTTSRNLLQQALINAEHWVRENKKSFKASRFFIDVDPQSIN